MLRRSLYNILSRFRAKARKWNSGVLDDFSILGSGVSGYVSQVVFLRQENYLTVSGGARPD